MKVVINLSSFIDEVFVALSSNNEEDLKELNDKFDHFCKTRNKESVNKAFHYILTRQIVVENKILKKYFEKFRM